MSTDTRRRDSGHASQSQNGDDLKEIRAELDTIREQITAGDPLQPISPHEAIEMYLEDRREDLAESTIEDYWGSLNYFREFCELNQIDNLNALDGRTMREYRAWRRTETHESNLSPKTMRDEMYLMRNFLQFLEDIEGVDSGLFAKVQTPDLSYEDEVREEYLPAERAKEILDHLRAYEYATTEHVVWLLFGVLGCRRGGVHSLDLEDVHVDCDEPYVEFHHRPEQGTSLKNKRGGEREVNLPQEVADVINDYIEHHRIDVTDDYGREPLLTTTHGRIAKSTIGKYIYKWTRPCAIGDECPHDRDPEDCEATQNAGSASKCPSSQPSHNVRKGYLTAERSNNIPVDVLADRCDVSPEVLEKHYDQRDKADRREVRKKIYDEVYGDSRGGYLD